MISRSKLILCLLVVFLPAAAFCQNTLGAAGIINGIKMSDGYIYAEATSAEWREASDNATDILRIKVEDWLSDNGSEADVEGIMEGKKVIRARRSELYRAFIYVQKPDMPAKQHIVSAKQQDRADTSETVTAAETSAEPVGDGHLTTDERKMLEVLLFSQIEPFISSLRGKNVIRDYGKYSTLPEGNCYLFVYDRAGEVVAAIRKEGASQTNLKTGETDDVSSYKGCGAIWFRMK